MKDRVVKQSNKGLKAVKAKKAILEQTVLSKYFYQNMHLLGFDKPSRVVNTVLRELCDNSLDACYDGGVLPILGIKISSGSTPKTYRITVRDNGPSLKASEIPKIAGKLLYGSKFGALNPSMGQQGLGLTAIIMYAQKSTGLPTTITSKTMDESKATRHVLQVDIERNEPKVVSRDHILVGPGSSLTVELQVMGTYTKNGVYSTPQLIKRYAYLNPCVDITYEDPSGQVTRYPRLTDSLPERGKAIGKIPHHQEVGDFQAFFSQGFNRESRLLDVLSHNYYGGSQLYTEILAQAKLSPYIKAGELSLEEIMTLKSVVGKKFQKVTPPSGAVTLLHNAIQLAVTKNYEINYDHVASAVSKPIFYNSGVIQVQACAFYGGPNPLDEKIQVQRVANCAPLTYHTASCGITKAIVEHNWKNHGLDQSEGELPRGPLLLLVHVSGSKVPYTTPSKDAISQNPKIIEAIKSCLVQVGRSIKTYRARQLLQASKDEKLIVITRTLPQIIRVVQSGVGRTLIMPTLKKMLAKIMQGLLIIQGKEEIQVINGEPQGEYRFLIGAPGMNPSEYTPVTVGPLEQTKYPIPPNYFIKGLNPLDYNIISKKYWDRLS